MTDKTKDEPVLAVTFIHDPNDPAENRCVLQVYEHAGKALSGEMDHLHEQGFKGPTYGMTSSFHGIQVSEVGHRGLVAEATFFKLSQLKPGFAKKFS